MQHLWIECGVDSESSAVKWAFQVLIKVTSLPNHSLWAITAWSFYAVGCLLSHCVSEASVVHRSFITDLLLAILLYLWTLLPISIEPEVKAQRYLTNTQRLMAANYVVQTELITLSKLPVMMVLNPDHVNTVLGQKHRHVFNHVLFFMCSTWNFGNTWKLTPS